MFCGTVDNLTEVGEMLHRGSIVRLLEKPSRGTRYLGVDTGILICDPYPYQGQDACAVGFFTQRHGPWVKTVLASDVEEAPEGCCEKTPDGVSRSYRPEYRTWMSMRRRCSDPRNQGFYLYGNRAKVCPEWESNFDRFYADVGPRPSPKHSLDRIDNDGDYKPGNVRWATPKEQARNTSKTRFVTALGQTKALTQWAEELGISVSALEYRLEHWDVETAVSRPMSKSKPYIEALKSRRKRGEAFHLSKLTEKEVLEIRRAHKGGEPNTSIAKRYGVWPTTIGYIVKRVTWKHLEEEE